MNDNEQEEPKEPTEEEIAQVEVEIQNENVILNTLELGNLRTIKLLNGQEIIGCILVQDKGYLYVKYPLQFIILDSGDGRYSIKLTKYNQFNHLQEQTSQPIFEGSVICYSRVKQTYVDFYCSQVARILQEDKEEVYKTKGFAWPNWMDEVQDKSKLN